MGTFELCAHVVLKYTDKEIRLILDAMKNAVGVAGHSANSYKEVQIHGDLAMRDFTTLVVPPRIPENMEPLLERCAREFGIAVIRREEELSREAAGESKKRKM